jgi:hypothetical protein
VNTTEYLDPELLPFTEDELFRAFALTAGEQEARDGAHFFADLLAGGAYEGGWSLPDAVFAAFVLVSDDLRERVEMYMRDRWERMRPSLIFNALRREGLPGGSNPTPSARRAADEEIARYIADWERGCAELADWVRRRRAGEPVGDEPPPWPGVHPEAE